MEAWESKECRHQGQDHRKTYRKGNFLVYFLRFFGVWCLDLSVGCLELSVGCLELSVGYLELSSGCLDLSFGCLELSFGCLDLSFGCGLHQARTEEK